MKIRCKLCNDIIKSEHRHDFKWCKCKKTYIDGGNDYTRYGSENLKDVELLNDGWGYEGELREDEIVKIAPSKWDVTKLPLITDSTEYTLDVQNDDSGYIYFDDSSQQLCVNGEPMTAGEDIKVGDCVYVDYETMTLKKVKDA